MLLSIFVYLASLGVPYDEDGNESKLVIGLCSAAFFLLISGSAAFFTNNISWPRLKYTFICPQKVLWVFYAVVYFAVGMARIYPTAPVSSRFGTIYVSLILAGTVANCSGKEGSTVDKLIGM
jgi:hypothetical protein